MTLTFSNPKLLANLYTSLASPTTPSTPISRPISATPTPLNLSPTIIGPAYPPGSLLPTQFKSPILSPQAVPKDKGKAPEKMPALSHLLSVGEGKRVLCIEVDERYIYAGCQGRDNEIMVFSRGSYQPKYRLLGHEGSILALLIVKERRWLVSSSSAGDVRIWSTETLQPIYIIHPCDDTSGDIYSLAWDDREGRTLYFGSQSASIEWVNFANPTQPNTSSSSDNTRSRKPSMPTASASLTVPVKTPSNVSSSSSPAEPLTRTGRYRPHPFFDRPPTSASGTSTPRSATPTTSSPIDFPSSQTSSSSSSVIEIEVEASSRLAFAHYGYIYALHLLPRSNNTSWLISGSGDSDIHIYRTLSLGSLDPTPIHTFPSLPGAVLSLCVRADDPSLLYAGLQGGVIQIFDLETTSVVRSIEVASSGSGADILGLSCGGDVVVKWW